MSRVEQAGSYILGRMQNELNENLYYHNVKHVIDVVQAAERIGMNENISVSEMELLKTAALFHDCGYIIDANDHEKLSCDIAIGFLPHIGFSPSEIQVICELIMATSVPQNPHNLLEQIICDADLDYLGRDDFFVLGYNIFREFKARNMVADEKEWNKLQVKFLTAHTYFTETSKKLRSSKKEMHLEKIINSLQQEV